MIYSHFCHPLFDLVSENAIRVETLFIELESLFELHDQGERSFSTVRSGGRKLFSPLLVASA